MFDITARITTIWFKSSSLISKMCTFWHLTCILNVLNTFNSIKWVFAHGFYHLPGQNHALHCVQIALSFSLHCKIFIPSLWRGDTCMTYTTLYLIKCECAASAFMLISTEWIQFPKATHSKMNEFHIKVEL